MHLARLAVAREHGDIARTADALGVLAEIALDEADAATARTYADEALAIAHPALPMEARDALITLARAAVAEGDLTGAATTLDRALEAADKIGQKFAVAQCSRVAGCLAAARGQAGQAVRLYAAAQRIAPSPSGTDEPVEGDLAGGLEPRAPLSVARRSSASGPSGPRSRPRGCASCSARSSTAYPSRGNSDANPVVTGPQNAYPFAGDEQGGKDAENPSVDAAHGGGSTRRGGHRGGDDARTGVRRPASHLQRHANTNVYRWTGGGDGFSWNNASNWAHGSLNLKGCRASATSPASTRSPASRSSGSSRSRPCTWTTPTC